MSLESIIVFHDAMQNYMDLCTTALFYSLVIKNIFIFPIVEMTKIMQNR